MCRAGGRRCRRHWTPAQKTLENSRRRVSRNGAKADIAEAEGLAEDAAAYRDLASKAAAEVERAEVDVEYAQHNADVEVLVAKARADGLESHVAHTMDERNEVWMPERRRLHDEILDDIMDRARGVPRDGKAIFAGGLGGAGKSTCLKGHAGVDPGEYVTLNPDDMKEELAKRDAIPKVEGLSPMEASTLVHEEASFLALSLADRCYQERANVMWDITMSSQKSVLSRVDALSQKGYDMRMVFVDIPPEVSKERAEARHRRGWEAHRQGEGLGGRYLPPGVTDAQADPEYTSKNLRVFESVKGSSSSWEVWDNSVHGRDPQLVSNGGFNQAEQLSQQPVTLESARR